MPLFLPPRVSRNSPSNSSSLEAIVQLCKSVCFTELYQPTVIRRAGLKPKSAKSFSFHFGKSCYRERWLKVSVGFETQLDHKIIVSLLLKKKTRRYGWITPPAARERQNEDVRCDGPILNGALISDSGRKLLANDVPASQNRLALASFISLFFYFHFNTI